MASGLLAMALATLIAMSSAAPAPASVEVATQPTATLQPAATYPPSYLRSNLWSAARSGSRSRMGAAVKAIVCGHGHPRVWYRLPNAGASETRSWSTLTVQFIVGGLALDGQYGPRTRRAVRAWQSRWNAANYRPGGENVMWNFRVPVDGTISAIDWEALRFSSHCLGMD